MPSFNYYLDMRENRKGERGIALWVRGCPKGETRPIIVRTGETIPQSKWDNSKQRVKPTYTGSPELNALLNQYEEDAKKCIRELELDRRNDFETAKAALRALFTPKKKNEFLTIFDEYLATQQPVWQPATFKKFKTLKAHLTTFAVRANFVLTFDAIDRHFEDAFRAFLVQDAVLLNNSVSKTFALVKTFLRWAEERGYHKNDAYRHFKVKASDKTEVIYLEREELMRLLEHDFSESPTLAKVRDVFCFQCFTGQRFSDIATFKFDDVKGNVWHIRTKKTRDTLQVPLTALALGIVEKYRADGRLPVISSQKTNQYIKEACRLAGIDTPTTIVRYRGNQRIDKTEPKYNLIASHTARRTFVSLSVANGMNHQAIMKITGHSDFKMLKKYLDVSDSLVSQEMEKAWK